MTIYERSSLNNELGAAINVPPNVARLLVPWGLDPVKARFVTSKGMRFDSYATLEAGAFHDHSQNIKVFGAPLYYSHRVDLHESLKRLATDPEGPGVPVKVHLKSEIRKYVRIRVVLRAPTPLTKTGSRRTVHHSCGRNGRDGRPRRCRGRHPLGRSRSHSRA